MSETINRTRIRELIVTEQKTVSELLHDLELSHNHVVLVGGKRVSLDYLIQENDKVVVLPLIAGG
ncbi:MAG: MoaD/ThiS family protein [Candidatus Sifarchaeia archaeon]